MARWSNSAFQAAALSSSLVTMDQIDETYDALRAPSSGDPEKPKPISDDQLAAKLIDLGFLNQWQVEQLREGRTKFNLGDYRIIDSIGRGGMGQVFKAEHTMLGRIEAIKVLPRDKSTPEAIESFRRETRTQAQLDHPNLVRVSYAGHDGNVYYLVTEFVPGADLRKLVRAQGPLTQEHAASIIYQAAQGLAYAHEQGLIHRDIKPGNLLVTPEGLTKVSDLGLAAFLSARNDPDDPRAGKVVGTADYIAPEQILTPHEITPSVDIYSLGCTLYYAVTGKVPFPGGSTSDKARRHCEDAPLHPRNFNAGLSNPLVMVIADMMEKDPAKRIANVNLVMQRLAPWSGRAVRMASKRPAAAAGTSDAPPPPPLVAEELQDTDSDIFEFPPMSPRRTGDSSQISQSTSAVTSAGEETDGGGTNRHTPPPPPKLPLSSLPVSSVVSSVVERSKNGDRLASVKRFRIPIGWLLAMTGISLVLAAIVWALFAYL